MHNKIVKIFICVSLCVVLLFPCVAAFASSVSDDWSNYTVVFNDYNQSGSSAVDYWTYWVQSCDFAGGGGASRGGGAGFHHRGYYNGESVSDAYDLVSIEGKYSTIATMLINSGVTFLNHFSFYRACHDLWDKLNAATQARLEAIYSDYVNSSISAWSLDGEFYTDWVSALTAYAESGTTGVFFDRMALPVYSAADSSALYEAGYKASAPIGRWASASNGPWAYCVTRSSTTLNSFDFTVINTLTNSSYVVRGFLDYIPSNSSLFTDFSVVGPFVIVETKRVQGDDGSWAEYQVPFVVLRVFLEYFDDSNNLNTYSTVVRRYSVKSGSSTYKVGDSAAFGSPSLSSDWFSYGHFHLGYSVSDSIVTHSETFGYGDRSTESGVVEDVSLFDAVLASNVFSSAGVALNNSPNDVEVFIPSESITDLENNTSGSYDYSTVPDASELPSEPVTPGPEYDPGDIEQIVPGLDDVKNFMWHINAIVDFFKGGIDSALDYIKLWKSYFSDILADIGQFPQFLASMVSMIPPQLLRLFTLSILCIGGLWLFRKLRS